MLAEKRQFTDTFPFEAYHRSEKIEITKENEYVFRNQNVKLENKRKSMTTKALVPVRHINLENMVEKVK